MSEQTGCNFAGKLLTFYKPTKVAALPKTESHPCGSASRWGNAETNQDDHATLHHNELFVKEQARASDSETEMDV